MVVAQGDGVSQTNIPQRRGGMCDSQYQQHIIHRSTLEGGALRIFKASGCVGFSEFDGAAAFAMGTQLAPNDPSSHRNPIRFCLAKKEF
jgi:hypothetical protein